jgi:hypothetical protein
MKLVTIIFGLVAMAALFDGCSNLPSASRSAVTAPAAKTSTAPAAAIIVPAGPEPAKITQLNTHHRFVVIDFGRRLFPSPNTRLIACRHDQPVATLRLSDSMRGRFAVADILDGEPRIGDQIQIP